MKRKLALCAVLLMMFSFLPPSARNIACADDLDEIELDIVKNQLLLESAQITDLGMEAAKNMLLRAFSENITEADVAWAAADAMIENGSSEYVEAFEVIVASGEQSALPHGDGSDDNVNLILPGEVVVVDLGARYRGYCTDLTRTFFMGNATEEMMKIYNITLEAQEAAFEVVSAGAWARDVDKAARDVISDYGYGENFTHGLGHGIGVYIHMPPLLSPSSNHILMESGDMAITIEPGIYIEGNFGVRTEDDVFVTRSGYEMLTFFPKDLESAILVPENYTNETSSLDEGGQEGGVGADFLLPLIAIFLLAVVGLVFFRWRRNPKIS
jgi:Xaa-Pro aminopeptidase